MLIIFQYEYHSAAVHVLDCVYIRQYFIVSQMSKIPVYVSLEIFSVSRAINQFSSKPQLTVWIKVIFINWQINISTAFFVYKKFTETLSIHGKYFFVLRNKLLLHAIKVGARMFYF